MSDTLFGSVPDEPAPDRPLSRRDDPKTSKEAAAKSAFSGSNEMIGREILSKLRERLYGEWSAEQMGDLVIDDPNCKARTHDRTRHGQQWLADNGYIELANKRGKTRLGGSMRLWRLTAKGKDDSIERSNDAEDET